jgi:hypothetical protein
MRGNHRRSRTRGEPRSISWIVPSGSQSSSAQNPDFCPSLEEDGRHPDQFTQTPLNPRGPI